MNLIREFKFSKTYKKEMSLFGAFPRSDSLRLLLRIPRTVGASSVKLLIHADALDFPDEGEKCFALKWTGLDGSCDKYELQLSLPSLCGKSGNESLFYYRYEIKCAEGTLLLGGEKATELQPCSLAGDRQLLLFDDDYTTCESMRGGIIYHVFVDRFKSSGRCELKKGAEFNPDWENGIPQYGAYPGAKVKNNVFFGGDLYGIAEKLDYIASLGTKTIYLSPVFEAASNHKYDTGDFLKVDSMFGGDEALRELTEKAKEFGINVILDGVFNHTGSDSVYFNREGNYSTVGAYNSPSSPYYNWYAFRDYPDDYECWWGVDILPHVKSANPDYLKFILDSVIEKWMNYGVYGWRLDVADELSDEFLTALRKKVKQKNPDAPIIGEVWEDASDKIAYSRRRHYFKGGQLDCVMNYPLREAVINFIKYGEAKKLADTVERLYRRYPKQSSDTLMNFLGSHDTQRILTVLGGIPQGDLSNAELSTLRMTAAQRKNAIKLLKLAYALTVACPGVPCVFYGDEAGLEGYRDPFCRMPFPWHNIEKSLLAHYRKLGKIRKGESLFASGTFENVYASRELFVFRRNPFNGEKYFILVVINRGEEAVSFDFSSDAKELISGTLGKKITVAPFEAAFIKLKLNENIDL